MLVPKCSFLCSYYFYNYNFIKTLKINSSVLILCKDRRKGRWHPQNFQPQPTPLYIRNCRFKRNPATPNKYFTTHTHTHYSYIPFNVAKFISLWLCLPLNYTQDAGTFVLRRHSKIKRNYHFAIPSSSSSSNVWVSSSSR